MGTNCRGGTGSDLGQLGECFEDRCSLERWSSGEQAVEDCSQRIDVTVCTHFSRVTVDLFWRHVAGCSDDVPGDGQFVLITNSFRQSKISDPRLSRFGQ